MPSKAPGRLFSPLSNRIYRHLFAAQILSLIGTGLTTVALALLAFDLSGGDAGVVLGTALFIKMIAYVGIAPLATTFGEKLPRRAFLVGLDGARARSPSCCLMSIQSGRSIC